MDQRASDSKKHLASDQDRSGDALSSILSHTAKANDVYDGACRDEMLVPLSVHDDEGNDDGGDGRCEGEGLRDASGGTDRLALHDQEVRIEVRVDGQVERH